MTFFDLYAGVLLWVLALGCLVNPSVARSLTASARKGCQDYLESYERLGPYSGTEGMVQKGLKTRGGYFKTVKKIKSLQECFQECVDSSKCSSFTYFGNKSKCSLSSKEGTTSSGSSSSSVVQFCPSNGATAGFVVKQSTTSSSGGYTSADVKTHNSRSSAWIIMDGNVYDVTKLLSSHPGGSTVILNVAGKNAESAFKSGGHSSSDRRSLEQYKIGSLVTSSTTPDSTPSTNTGGQKIFTASQVQTHDNRDSAWTVIDGAVYDLTDFVNRHPGGSSAILKAAGKDGSIVFNKRGRHSSSDRRTLEAYMIGELDTSSGGFLVNDPSFVINDDGDFTDDDDDDDDDEFTDNEGTDDEGDDTDDEGDDTDDEGDDTDDD